MPLQNRSLSRVCSNSVFKMLNGRLPMKEEFQGPKNLEYHQKLPSAFLMGAWEYLATFLQDYFKG